MASKDNSEKWRVVVIVGVAAYVAWLLWNRCKPVEVVTHRILSLEEAGLA